MRSLSFFAFILFLALSSDAADNAPRFPNSHITAEDWNTYLAEVKALPGVAVRESNQQITITDQRAGVTLYAFTTPNNPAHPGVVIRKVVRMDDGSYAINRVGYYAGDAEQFKRWWHAFDALDEKIKADMKSGK